MSKNWMQERRRDYYYRKAKQLDYRSRASFKLIQINDRFNLFEPGMAVVDLGAAPGGWLQVAAERVGPKGTVVGVDLQPIEPLEGVRTIKGDIRREEVREELLAMLQDAGFSSLDLFYPYPDYKICDRLHSDRFLPRPGDLEREVPSYDQERFVLFDEGLAFDGIASNGAFPLMANSFLVICRR